MSIFELVFYLSLFWILTSYGAGVLISILMDKLTYRGFWNSKNKSNKE